MFDRRLLSDAQMSTAGSNLTDVHLHLHLPPEWAAQLHPVIDRLETISDQLETVISVLHTQQSTTQQTGTQIMALLDDLTAQVAQSTQVDQSALVLIQGIAARLTAAAGDPTAIKALTDQLNASATALSKAVVDNTPAATGGGGGTAAKPLYTYVGADPTTIDAAAYPTATVKAADGTTLYNFNADTAGQPATGVTADFTEYTGPTA